MIKVLIRPGAYYDSVVLMQLQRALVAMPNVDSVGVVMATQANKDVLAQDGLLSPEGNAAGADDLVIAVRALDTASAEAALAAVNTLLAHKHVDGDLAFRPKSLAAAAQMLPAARWVLISVPGRFAAGVARDALRLGKNVFLYSDNVPVEDEIDLKRTAAAQGLMVMGPDCGTALVNGIGLGFANQVRRGAIGLVGASGTGLQLVTARIHQLGGGVTHALGTGGRDLSEAVGAITARQSLDLLARDPDTRVIVIISKPPAAHVADELIRAARATGKIVIIDFIGHQTAEPVHENVYFVSTLDSAAALAVELADFEDATSPVADALPFAPGQRYLRGIYSGGTLAYEAQLILRDFIPVIFSNAPLDKTFTLAKATESQANTIVDLGEDEFTVGRLHPMMDNELRVRRILQEAADPGTAVILLDVVLGHGAHPDPASELAPAIDQAQKIARAQGRRLDVIAVVVGTDADPQNLAGQVEQLEGAGALVETSHENAVRRAGALIQGLNRVSGLPPVELAAIGASLAAINVGLESFAASLAAQQAAAVHVDWRPPAGGNEKLMGILERLKAL